MLQPLGGAVICREPPLGGCWSPEEDKNHITYLEMLTIKLALDSFEERVKQQHVKLMVDTMTTLTIFNIMGTSRCWKLNELNKTYGTGVLTKEYG